VNGKEKHPKAKLSHEKKKERIADEKSLEKQSTKGKENCRLRL